jgi:hypothetical protein
MEVFLLISMCLLSLQAKKQNTLDRERRLSHLQQTELFAMRERSSIDAFEQDLRIKLQHV